MQDRDAAALRAEKAERKLLQQDQETHDEVQESSTIDTGVARVATIIQGGVLTVENSPLNAGFESTGSKECGVGPEQEQGLISDHRRLRFPRKGRRSKLTLKIPRSTGTL